MICRNWRLEKSPIPFEWRRFTNSISRQILADLWGKRIDYSVDGSSGALHNAVRDILRCNRRALRHIPGRADRSRLNAANSNREAEHD